MKLYVACLASYNNGRLHGAWIDASAEADDMRADIATMLRASPFPNVMVECPDCEGDGTETHHNSETGETRVDTCQTCKGAGEVPSAEEYAVHDYDDFPNMGEYPDLDAVAAMAELIETAQADHGISYDDFKPISDNWHGNIDDISNALDNFAGIFDTLRDYADEVADEALAADGIKEGSFAQRHFDYESHARDIEIEYTVIDCPSGVAVFWPH